MVYVLKYGFDTGDRQEMHFVGLENMCEAVHRALGSPMSRRMRLESKIDSFDQRGEILHLQCEILEKMI